MRKDPIVSFAESLRGRHLTPSRQYQCVRDHCKRHLPVFSFSRPPALVKPFHPDRTDTFYRYEKAHFRWRRCTDAYDEWCAWGRCTWRTTPANCIKLDISPSFLLFPSLSLSVVFIGAHRAAGWHRGERGTLREGRKRAS